MAADNTRYDIDFRAPALPYPPQEYLPSFFEKFNSILRMYFVQLDNALRSVSRVTYSSSATGDYAISGNYEYEILVMANTTAATVTLPASPEDQRRVSIKRTNALVTIDGNGKNIDGFPILVLNRLYDAPHLIYTDAAGEWSIL